MTGRERQGKVFSTGPSRAVLHVREKKMEHDDFTCRCCANIPVEQNVEGVLGPGRDLIFRFKARWWPIPTKESFSTTIKLALEDTFYGSKAVGSVTNRSQRDRHSNRCRNEAKVLAQLLSPPM